MTLLETLKRRGFVHQTTDETELNELLANAPVTYYAGFDPTANSLHVGHLVPLMLLAHMQRAGHRPIAIVGAGTSRVGDPSGRTELRTMLTEEQIAENCIGMREHLARFLRFDDTATGALMIDNSEWLLPLRYIDFLRDIGRYFAVNQMIKAKGYAERLEREQGLSFIEFNYQILQAYDYLVLNQRYGCRLQVGGADQWGNIVAGVDLIRRVESVAAHAITIELIMTSTGEKMGKTASGAVWLDEERTSVYDFYQYWRNVDDRDIRRFLALFTFMPLDDVDRIGNVDGKGAAEINAAKETLALEVTTLVHGAERAATAQEAARALFSSGGAGDLSNVPSTTIAASRADEGIALADLLVETGLLPSKKEARRKIDERGVYIGDRTIDDARMRITAADFADGALLLRVGKKSYHRVVLEG